ncbi:class I SAM-dependent methyltransferase [Collimonas antrihumi]|uniref:class I SAM-dependent methyltransferase n=1 Tax=Collimonas antrihumi TaxID=1940615 RepID=UPI001B8D7C13|nr:class I SAM-dependent methyltransferase [Collimonas antrihumi]
MENKTTDILAEVADYYSAKLAEHGETPRGVDWNGEESQELRFDQLAQVIPQLTGFSLNDLGCGYGALFDYLNSRCRDFAYSGSDVSAGMIRAAQDRHSNRLNARFAVAAEPPDVADYGIASGIFNVRLGRSDAEWYNYLEATLDLLNRTSRLGFAFNCLTSYSDSDKMRNYLYYADPCVLFDLCKRRYSRHVALLHDYGLYEFTILVKKHP